MRVSLFFLDKDTFWYKEKSARWLQENSYATTVGNEDFLLEVGPMAHPNGIQSIRMFWCMRDRRVGWLLPEGLLFLRDVRDPPLTKKERFVTR